MSRWFTSNFFRYSFLIFIRVCALYNRFVSLHGAIKFIATSICPCLTSLKFLWSWLETAIISTITPCPSAIRFSIVLGCWSHSLCYLLFPKIYIYIFSHDFHFFPIEALPIPVYFVGYYYSVWVFSGCSFNAFYVLECIHNWLISGIVPILEFPSRKHNWYNCNVNNIYFRSSSLSLFCK